MTATIEKTPSHELVTDATFLSLPVTLIKGKTPLLALIGHTTTSPWLVVAAEQPLP